MDNGLTREEPHYERSAYHECGHAMFSLRHSCFQFESVLVYASPQYLENRGYTYGRCHYQEPIVPALREQILLALAGPEAERLFDPSLTPETAGWDIDYLKACKLIRRLHKVQTEEDVLQHFESYRREAAEFVAKHQEAISKVAERLLQSLNEDGDYCLEYADLEEFGEDDPDGK